VALAVLNREAVIDGSLLRELDVVLRVSGFSVVLNVDIVTDVRLLRELYVIVSKLGRGVLANREMVKGNPT
jgi:hypothetical protein